MITDELLFRFIEGNTSVREKREINQWLSKDPDHTARLELLRSYWSATTNDSSSTELAGAWETLQSRMDQYPPSKHSRTLSLNLKRLAVAATLLVLMASGALLLLQSGNRTIRNTDNTTYSFFLPDGTQVFLGPDSRLTYSRKLAEGERIVTLKGEAYFDVEASLARPFIVHTGKASVEVTGTKFAVNVSRKSDEVEVSVKSGKVLFYNSLTMSKNAFRMGLGPGEKGIYSPARNRMDKTRDPNILTTP
jgi:transmembrane sensor